MMEPYYYIADLFRYTYTGKIISSFVELALLVGPYFVISILLNTLLRRYFLNRLKFQSIKNEILSILTAGFIGIVSPLPTFIAVPMGVSLLNTGISLGAVTAFIVASPLMNPGVFVITWTQLGIDIAVARAVSAFLLAIAAGFGVRWIGEQRKRSWHKYTQGSCTKGRSFLIELKRSTLYLGRYFGMALLLGAAVRALVPTDFIGRILGGQASLSLAMAVALGVPFYSCGGAAIPLVQVLSEMGMSKGAVLAFFITGPSTKMETMAVYKSLLGIRIFLLYLGFMVIGAFLSGILFMGFY